MISLNFGNFNTDIEAYNKLVVNLDVCSITCPHCKHADMVRHAYYTRYINISGEKIKLTILRIKCKTCGTTHAVLPSFVVPYLHHPIEQLQSMIVIGKTDETSLSQEYETKLIRKIKKRWLQIVMSFGLELKSELFKLVKRASMNIRRCFMQIHSGYYKFDTRIHTT